MKQEYQDIILQECGAKALGYCQIVKVHLDGCYRPSVVVKHVMFPKEAEHPGGWKTDLSHMRKMRSYQVETLKNQRASRHDELDAMYNSQLKAAAGEIDRILNECRFKTIIHGDAKLANFCFPGSGQGVAAVDFQYVGRGCGMKDVVYLLEEIEEKQLEKRVPSLLDYYFTELRASVTKQMDFAALEKEWREMFAWTDFHRFLLGWMPGHQKINRYTKQLTKEVLRKVKR
uniref:CHK kinase-like domain-containing protein n=1 Tax=Oncorhynchus mykiss TaxID=8022 RepID=A0A8K9XN99_ONCMY